MKKVIGVVSAALVVLALHAPAQALDMRFGASANYGISNDFGVGPRLEVDLTEYVPGLRIAADVHRFFDSRVYSDIDGLSVVSSSWDTGLHVTYDFATVPILQGATLYGGLGIIYAERTYDHWLKNTGGSISDSELRARYDKLETLQGKYESGTGVGVALSLGSTFNTGWTVLPFVEGRYTIGVIDEFMLAAGIMFTTGPAIK